MIVSAAILIFIFPAPLPEAVVRDGIGNQIKCAYTSLPALRPVVGCAYSSVESRRLRLE
jgi:hypothetical protein